MLKKDAYIDEEGVYRWKTNDRVPFDDLLEQEGVCVEVREKCRIARDKETQAILARYNEAQHDYRYSDEELFEMQAAFGPGSTVVDVITGRKIDL